jgi:dTDP-4-dehydrorhamnose 3,5-epimerase
MRVTPTALPEVLLLEPTVYRDSRGSFFEAYNRRAFAQALGIDADFVQENQSISLQRVLRGLHYQIRNAQGKLIRVVEGRVYDVAVDLRRSSPRFGKWAAAELSADEHRLIWVPPGFAHGFLVLSERATFIYKVTDYWAPEHERTLAWNDPHLSIPWPIQGEPMLSEKDRAGVALRDAEVYP